MKSETYPKLFKNRVEDREWHKLPIVSWYPSKKAVKTLVGSFRANLKLHPKYVQVINNDYVRVWGEFVNLTCDNNLRTWDEKKYAAKI